MKRFVSLSIIGIVLASTSASAPGATTCPKRMDNESFSGVVPWILGQGVGFSTKGLAVDADGAPNSYLVDGNGLSDTCDGVVAIVDGKRVTPKSDPQHWLQICRDAWTKAKASGDFSKVAIFGFLADPSTNVPIVQKQGDPLPGTGYISTTTMPVPNTGSGTQRHYVDAVEIPYVVLPDSFVKAFRVSRGDIAIVYRSKTQKMAFGVYADGGGLGEASVRLHQDLGNDPIVTIQNVKRARRGIDDRVVTVVFPGITSHGTVDAKTWRDEIESLGKNALDQLGGLDQLKACAK